MTTMALADLKIVLDLHRKWMYGEEGGARANLARANLVGANLVGANLVGANLARANLDGANLARANLDGANLARANLVGANLDGANLVGANLDGARLSDGITFGEYLAEVVPALLTAGGKPLADVANAEVWNCHSWDNCPMHAAFGAKTLKDVPALHRWQAARFIQFFDAHLIPLPTLPEAVV